MSAPLLIYVGGEAIQCPRYVRAGNTTSEGDAFSLHVEERTGADSIPTIRRVYQRTPRGKFCCVWPGCKFTSWDEMGTWLHVHGKRHHDEWKRKREAKANA